MTAKKKVIVKAPTSQITRSTAGLREALFEEMEALRSGQSNSGRARSVALMANSILQSVQVEIEYHRYVNGNHRQSSRIPVTQIGIDIPLTNTKTA